MMRALAIAASMMLIPAQAERQIVPCNYLVTIMAVVEKYQEIPAFDGRTTDNKLPVRIFVNPTTRTFSIVVEPKPAVIGCLYLAGENFKPAGPLLSPPL